MYRESHLQTEVLPRPSRRPFGTFLSGSWEKWSILLLRQHSKFSTALRCILGDTLFEKTVSSSLLQRKKAVAMSAVVVPVLHRDRALSFWWGLNIIVSLALWN